jgi:hypothetical protein
MAGPFLLLKADTLFETVSLRLTLNGKQQKKEPFQQEQPLFIMVI